MNKLRPIICEYYSNLVNEIDIKCEKAIFVLKDREETVNDLIIDREKVISKIKQVEKIKMKNLKESETLYDNIFCFLIPADREYDSDDDSDDDSDEYSEDDYEEDSDEYNSDEESLSNEETQTDDNPPSSRFDIKLKLCRESNAKFEFLKNIGQLVVVNVSLDENLHKSFLADAYKRNYYDTLEEITKYKILDELIKDKRGELIVDLVQKENNRIQKISINSFNEIKPAYFEFIETCLNIESIRQLEFVYTKDLDIPKEIFKPFRHINKLDVILYCPLDANTFSYLENLEYLKISRSTIGSFHANVFKSLKNLKELTIHGSKLELKSLNGLDSLKKLTLYNNAFKDFRLDFLNPLRNLESLELWENTFNRFTKDPLELNSLKVFESDVEIDTIEFGDSIEILSLKSQNFKLQTSFKNLKFLNLRNCPVKDIDFLNEMTQLEFLDFQYPNHLANKFKQLKMPSLRYLVTTGKNVPHFNTSFRNLKGLELIEPKHYQRDTFKNLSGLDYLVITESDDWLLKKLEQKIFFKGIKNLKYLRVESSDFKVYDVEQRKNITSALSSLFISPENVVSKNSFVYKFGIEMYAKINDEDITEEFYFENHLELSESVREFLLNNKSKYYQTCLRNTRRRQENFALPSDHYNDQDNESSEEYCCSRCNGENSDDDYMYGRYYYDSDDDYY